MKKNITRICLAVAAIISISACNDDFMERYPTTQLSSKGYFSSADNLKSYTDGLYQTISTSVLDVTSDNCLYSGSTSVYEMMCGRRDPGTESSWSWTNIRKVNYMLGNLSDEISGVEADVNHYIGLARFFRAYHYFSKVQQYSDVPWYEKALNTDDEELLYKTQDSREYVMGKIMEDLKFAVENMQDKSSKIYLYRDAALALQARIALYEGTFRKYHSELGLNDYNDFLKTAVEACEAIMDKGAYTLSSDYESIFNSSSLSGASASSEIIFYIEYLRAKSITNSARSVFCASTTLQKDLMEDYLYLDSDGKAIPFTQVEGYESADLHEFYRNRDKRLEQTFFTPGFKRTGDEQAYANIQPSLCGYPQIKFYPYNDYLSWNQSSETDLPVLRYAEVLLNFAEAKAELGTLTQDDLDRSINLLRSIHGGLPSANLSDWLSVIDPVQEERYSNVSGEQKGAILEIRRERRVEMVGEGLRYNDLMRWCCGKLLEKTPQGLYIKGVGLTDGLMDVNGDDTPDICIVNNSADYKAAVELTKTKYPKLVVYNIDGQGYALTEGTKGYLYITSQSDFHWEEPKYYYAPISTTDITLNPNLVQNKYWK